MNGTISKLHLQMKISMQLQFFFGFWSVLQGSFNSIHIVFYFYFYYFYFIFYKTELKYQEHYFASFENLN